MKPLERIFFIACIKNIETMKAREVIKTFCTLGFSEKQLLRYIEKWLKNGFYDYGVTIDLGWFEPENFIGEYKVIYEEIVGEKGGAE